MQMSPHVGLSVPFALVLHVEELSDGRGCSFCILLAFHAAEWCRQLE